MKKIYLFAAFIFSGFVASAQQIISVAPNSVSPGTQPTVLITTTGIYLSQSTTTVDFGPGITVTNTEVIQGQMVRAQLDVNQAAATGTRKITLKADQQTLEYNNFEVATLGGNVTAIIEVIPVQKIYLTDLDPSNPALAPTLFNVTIMNDGVQRSLQVKLTTTGQNTGLWGTATKNLSNTQPNAVVRFNSKEFDKYTVNTTRRGELEEAVKSGKLPTDVYEYKIEVFESGVKVTETVGRNIIDNPVARPELIGPGAPLNMQPDAIATNLPFFQWFSQASSHTISVYPVFPNQKTKEEITLNRPVWTQTDVAGKNILYPASAEIMQPGTTYAWQVTGIIHSANGNEQLFSDVYWFTYTKSELQNIAYSRVVIEPEISSVPTGGRKEFKLYGIDENNTRYDITDKAVWKVLPTTLGTVQQGVFTAGAYPENVAVVAQYGTEQVFAEVQITPGITATGGGFDIEIFMRELFGIPAN